MQQSVFVNIMYLCSVSCKETFLVSAVKANEIKMRSNLNTIFTSGHTNMYRYTMTFENFIWNGLNKDIIVVDVTFDEIKLCFPCSGYFKCISDTLPSNHNTCTELNKTHLIPKKKKNPVSFFKRVPERYRSKQHIFEYILVLDK